MNFKFRHLSTVVNPREYVLYTESTVTKLIAGLSQRTYLALNLGFKSAGDVKGKGDFLFSVHSQLPNVSGPEGHSSDDRLHRNLVDITSWLR